MMSNYTIRHGDTLTRIGSKFGFDGWKPIWIYNHNPSISHPSRLGADPDKIIAGTVIVIPRKKLEYDEAIKRLIDTKAEMDRSFREQAEETEKLNSDMERFSERLDLTADLLMIGKGGVKAMFKYGPRIRNLALAKRAFEATSSILIYLSEDKQGKVGKTLDISGEAASEQVIPILAKRGFSAGDFFKSAAKGTLKEGAKKAIELGAERAAKAIGNAEMAAFAKDVVGVACDFAIHGEKAIEKISPSFLSKAMIGLATGESPEVTVNNAKALIEKSRLACARRLQTTIDKLTSERNVVYVK